jgi:DNA-binding MarR family transcriptional regulator
MKDLESIRGGLRLWRAISPQIRASQIDMLLTIALNPGVSQTELSNQCDIGLSAVSRMVDVMSTAGRRDGKGQALGLVIAERAIEDDRTVVLRLSSKGTQLIALYQEMSS